MSVAFLSLAGAASAAAAPRLPVCDTRAAPPPEPLAGDRLRAVELIAAGRNREAEQLMVRAAAAAADDPEPSWIGLLALRWQLLAEPEDEAVRERFDRAVEDTLARARSEPGPAGERLAGSAWLLRAEALARRGQPLRAGRDARRGKHALEHALAAAPCDGDAAFGLGAYNYFADHVPALLKGLRALLFIPGGDTALGLSQLEMASQRARTTRLEADLLLAVLLASPAEDRYDEALAHARAAAERAPFSPAASLALAEALDGTGREPEAAALLERFLAGAGSRFDHAAEVRAAAALHLARLRLRDLQAGEARRVLRAASISAAPAGDYVLRCRSLLLSLAWETEGAAGDGPAAARAWGLPWPPRGSLACEEGFRSTLDRIWNGAGDAPPSAAAGLGSLIPSRPCAAAPSARIDLSLARLLLRVPDPARAGPLLRSVANASAEPDLAGWARIHLAALAVQRGSPVEARRWLAAAAEMRGFHDRRRARYELRNLAASRPAQ